jgi:hypothetical protein
MSIRWLSFALVLLASSSLVFAEGRRSLASCTSFDQRDKDDVSVQFTIKNSCTVPVDCAITWRVVCAPQSKKRRAVHAKSVKLALTEASSSSAEASAAVCGDDAFEISGISWSCQPNGD